MIVVDTNVIAYLLLPGDHTDAARGTLTRDPAWAAPMLWRSELRNVLAVQMQHHHLSLADARDVQHVAEELLEGREYAVESAAVLELAAASRQSAYDCEFVALARALAIPLITADRELLASFPDVAISLTDYGN